MAEHDANPPKSPRDLLGELERIKDMLERGQQPPGDGSEDYPDIPVLSDVVADPDADADELLDIDEIFDEPAAAQEPEPAADDTDDTQVDADSTLDLNHLDELDIDFPSFTLDAHSDSIAAGNPEPVPVGTEDAPPADPISANADLWPESLTEASAEVGADQVQEAAELSEEPSHSEAQAGDASEAAADSPAEAGADRQQLIDALVAEYLPQIEAELRRRLQQVDIEELTRGSEDD